VRRVRVVHLQLLCQDQTYAHLVLVEGSPRKFSSTDNRPSVSLSWGRGAEAVDLPRRVRLGLYTSERCSMRWT
jgi:hypothetical protein